MKNYLKILSTFLFTLIFIGTTKMMAQESEKVIEFEFEVNASPYEVYDAWTTLEGIKSFFAREGKVELKKFGDYHIIFLPENEPGTRGAEDEKVISYEKDKMISFTWGFPPSLMDLRNNQKTIINIRFYDAGNGKTKVHFLNTGWGVGEDWQKGYEYFTQAWGNVVLARLQYRFDHGPVDWDNPPDYSEFALANK